MTYKVLSGYLFGYNEHTGMFMATKREDFKEMFNGDKGNVIKMNSMEALMEFIMKTDGDPAKIEQLLSENKAGESDFLKDALI